MKQYVLCLILVVGASCSMPAPDGAVTNDNSSTPDSAGPAESTAYVVTGGATGVYGVFAISTKTNEIVGAVDTGGMLGSDVALTPDGSRAIVVGVPAGGGGQAMIISTATNTIDATIDLAAPGINALFVDVSIDGAFAFATHGGTTGVVYKISTTSNAVVDSVEIGVVAGRPTATRMTPDGSTLYILDEGLGTGNISAVSTSDLGVVLIDTELSRSRAMDMTPDGATLYTSGGIPAELWAVSTTTNRIESTIEINTFAQIEDFAISPNGESVYVFTTNGSFGQAVAIVSTATNSVTQTIEVDENLESPADIAFGPSGAFLYAAFPGQNAVLAFSTDDQTFLEPISVGSWPEYMAFAADASALYITNRFSNSVSVMSTATHTVVSTISSVGDQPKELAITP
jgi:YVTN family beta-propeller protein